MIKRIRFATRRGDVPPGTFPRVWTSVVAAAADAPPGVRPARVAVCTNLREFTGPAPRHDGIGVEWFTDAGHLHRFAEWLDTPPGRALTLRAGGVLDRARSPVVVADESVLRGADWLGRRWRDGGDRLKHMALARRADGLTPAEFSARWRGHAGRVGAAGAVAIPEHARGCAYVQNHPHPRSGGEWAYDAVNEVYFDDGADLRARIEWFRENLPEPGGDGLFGRSWFLAVRERIVSA
ncbi:hypothetical protein DPM19_23930 [Actinomadura craniellae]|uniref:Uncharacterized protein n=1 Tax=Actinomadura craniellae TaxID=2231787 RepID=A0A365H0Q1_9ACTN|nr:EthD domain-containing protein [Actinomadura craniellae]RAY12647.1 hypothetical protein DPM19_23930 [Actinomadura craniellae]